MASVFTRRLIEALGPDVARTDPVDLAAYGYDALKEGGVPSAALLPGNVRDVATALRIAHECGEPVVPRGAGTGLCGGAVPIAGGLVVSFARMNRILELDVRNRRARVQPGLINLELSQAIAQHGVFYAPDPSSQKISTIGGNVGTNAGGPHCLSYGTTTNHILGLQYVDSVGAVHRTSVDDPGYDLTGLLVGSEGTLGVVTEIDVRLMRLPEAVRVFVATFGDVEAASEAVSAIIGAGIIPVALEIMDELITQAVEAHFHAGFPADAGAVLLVEIAGARDDMDAGERAIAGIAREHGALSWRAARDAPERAALWAARKGAAGALGRIAPNYYIQDACVPRTKLPQVMHEIERIAREYRLPVGNVFHAGDGNLHPLLVFDRREPGAVQAVMDAGSAILRTCIAMGGTISGEHGIGYEKSATLPLVFSPQDLAAMGRVRDVFDPRRAFNPDKIFPSGAVCGEVTAAADGGVIAHGSAYALGGIAPARVEEPVDAAGVASVLGTAARQNEAVVVFGGGTLQAIGNAPRRYDVALSLRRLDAVLQYDPRDLTIGVGAGMTVDALARALAQHGQFIPFDVPQPQRATVGGTLAAGWAGPRRGAYGHLRDLLIGSTVALTDGTLASAGGMVVKNVTGYDMGKLYVGSLGTLAAIVRANFKTLPRPAAQRLALAPLAPEHIARTIDALGELTLEPSAALVVDGFFERVPRLRDEATRLVILLEGSPAALDRTTRELRSVLGKCGVAETRLVDANAATTIFAATVDAYVEPVADRSITYRSTGLPSTVWERAAAAVATAHAGGAGCDLIADIRTGDAVARIAGASATHAAERLRGIDGELRRILPATTVLAGDERLRALVDAWGAVPSTMPTLQATKTRFDPAGILAPGRYVGGL